MKNNNEMSRWSGLKKRISNAAGFCSSDIPFLILFTVPLALGIIGVLAEKYGPSVVERSYNFIQKRGQAYVEWYNRESPAEEYVEIVPNSKDPKMKDLEILLWNQVIRNQYENTASKALFWNGDSPNYAEALIYYEAAQRLCPTNSAWGRRVRSEYDLPIKDLTAKATAQLKTKK